MEKTIFKNLESQIKDLDESKGIVQIYVNSYNIEDSDGDISVKGSFKKTIKENKNIDIEIDTQEIGLARNYLADNTRFRETFLRPEQRKIPEAILELWQKLEEGHDYNDDRFYTDKWHKKINS